MKISRRYLVFPIARGAEEKIVTFSVNGQPVYDLSMRLSHDAPDFYAFVDVSRFLGQDVVIEAEGEALPPIDAADAYDHRAPFDPANRPLLHFSPRSGWNNDPNGLVYANGTYHMFFQHNPCDTVWGNMHWGHATSTDLVHWQQQETALFPDELGVMFSGSAIVDERNLLGLKQGDTDVILLYYTAEPINRLAEGRQTTQCLAYSVDNGKTFVKYPGNPVVPTIVNGNRDPKVVWDEASARYMMALYLDGDRYALLHSTDLLHWDMAQELRIEGDNECPDLLLMTADDGSSKAVIGGAHGCYQVGDLESGLFVPTQPVRRLYLNEYCYAHQTYSGTPGRVVQTTWQRANAENLPFSQELSFPCELTLHRTGAEYRLRAQPVRELSLLACENGQREAALPLVATLTVPQDAPLTLSLGGQTILLDGMADTVTAAGEVWHTEAPLGGSLLTLLVDRYTLKLHLCGGEALLAQPVRWHEETAAAAALAALQAQITPLGAAIQL